MSINLPCRAINIISINDLHAMILESLKNAISMRDLSKNGHINYEKDIGNYNWYIYQFAISEIFNA